MSKKKTPPKYLIIYKCGSCGHDSAYTDREKPRCRSCDRPDKLIIISRQEITPEVVVTRLKAVADKIMTNLTQAYEELPNTTGNIVAEGKDAEFEILRLMDRAKKLRDKLYQIDLKKRFKR